MKKRDFFSQGNSRWNKLISQFRNLHHRITNGVVTKQQHYSLLERLNRVYNKLQKMQHKVGVKIAGTSLALMLLAANADAQQLTFEGYVKYPQKTVAAKEILKRSVLYAHVAVADVDNDGKLDAFIGAYGEPSYPILKFKKQDDGSFAENGILDTAGLPIIFKGYCSPTFVDLDKDGDQDLVVGSKEKISFFLNDGQGKFSLDTIWNNTNFRAPTPAFIDIDGDGDVDLFFGEYEGYMYVSKNIGAEKFEFSTIDTLKDANNNDIDVGYNAVPAFVDIDADGNLDLLIGDYDGTIEIFKQQADGKFKKNGDFLEADGKKIDLTVPAVPLFYDLDEDGDLDLFLSAKDTVMVEYKNGGSFNFSKQNPIEFEFTNLTLSLPVTSQQSSIQLFDFDKDEDLDLFYRNKKGYITFVKNDGQGVFSGRDTVEINGSYLKFYKDFSFVTGIDGTEALLAPLEPDKKYRFYYNKENGSFAEAGKLLLLNNGSATQSISSSSKHKIRVIDLDDDGNLDMLMFASSYYGFQAMVAYSFSSQNPKRIAYIQSNQVTSSYGDIDSDGDIDVLLGTTGGNVIPMLKSETGTWSISTPLKTDGELLKAGSLPGIVIGDIDKDGKDEMLIAGELDYYISVYEIEPPQTTNIENITNGTQMKLYPNPASNVINIELAEGNIKGLTIFDITGKIAYEMDKKLNTSQTQIDISNLNKGIYYLKIQTDKDVLTHKIIKK